MRSPGPPSRTRDTVSASGGGGEATTHATYAGEGVLLEGTGAGYLDAEMEAVSERTTSDGIRLVVRSTQLGDPLSEACEVDGLVRVGIVDGDLVDVTIVESRAGRRELRHRRWGQRPPDVGRRRPSPWAPSRPPSRTDRPTRQKR